MLRAGGKPRNWHSFIRLKASPSPLRLSRTRWLSTRHLQKAPGTRSREKCCEAPVLNISGDRTAKAREWTNNPIDGIDGLDIQAYIDTRLQEKSLRDGDRGISPDSIRLEVRLLSAVFKHAVQCRSRDSNPALARQSGYVLPRSNVRDTRLTPSQESAISQSAYDQVAFSRRTNPSLFPWLEFVRATGCRPGEAARIELDWLNIDKRHVDIPRRGTKKRYPRRVLLTELMIEILAPQVVRAQDAGSPYLFFSFSNRKPGEIVPYRYNTGWRQVRKQAGVKMEAHGLRRNFISQLFETSQLTDGQIALLAGDINPMSLEPYKHLRATALRPQYEAFQALQDSQRSHSEKKEAVIRANDRLGIDLENNPELLQKLLESQHISIADRIDPAIERREMGDAQWIEESKLHRRLLRESRRKRE
jgi:integrase